jgi:two-component system alkaline phosphatase synthesis response regulator PhoP
VTRETVKVLIADDDADFRELLRRHLQGAGLDVVQAEDGEAAVATFDEDDEIALAILDIRMPGMGGLRALEAIRARRGAGVGLVVLSGSDDRQDVMRAAKAGADDYLRKPVNGPVLLASVRSQLERLGLAA